MNLIVSELKRIFSVDDDENDNLLLMTALKAAGFAGKLEFAADGEEAIEILEKLDRDSHPNFVMLDVNMPRQNGLEALQRLRANEKLRSIPVAIFTSSDQPEEIARAYEFGADIFLVKPLAFDDLLDLARIVGQFLECDDRDMSRFHSHSSCRLRKSTGSDP